MQSKSYSKIPRIVITLFFLLYPIGFFILFGFLVPFIDFNISTSTLIKTTCSFDMINNKEQTKTSLETIIEKNDVNNNKFYYVEFPVLYDATLLNKSMNLNKRILLESKERACVLESKIKTEECRDYFVKKFEKLWEMGNVFNTREDLFNTLNFTCYLQEVNNLQQLNLQNNFIIIDKDIFENNIGNTFLYCFIISILILIGTFLFYIIYSFVYLDGLTKYSLDRFYKQFILDPFGDYIWDESECLTSEYSEPSLLSNVPIVFREKNVLHKILCHTSSSSYEKVLYFERPNSKIIKKVLNENKFYIILFLFLFIIFYLFIITIMMFGFIYFTFNTNKFFVGFTFIYSLLPIIIWLGYYFILKIYSYLFSYSYITNLRLINVVEWPFSLGYTIYYLPYHSLIGMSTPIVAGSISFENELNIDSYNNIINNDLTVHSLMVEYLQSLNHVSIWNFIYSIVKSNNDNNGIHGKPITISQQIFPMITNPNEIKKMIQDQVIQRANPEDMEITIDGIDMAYSKNVGTFEPVNIIEE
ncbi:hypothetical protein ABK040_005126 [Willaertia magna]